jgi:predicted nucleic-acid-binding protein
LIGVDTNVLARLFVTDNAQQHAAARRFFAERSADDPAFVSALVQAELVWLLERTMRFPIERIVDVLQGILSSADFVVEHSDLLEEALHSWTGNTLDLADYLIAGIARRAGCEVTATFDKAAARRVPGMELLK